MRLLVVKSEPSAAQGASVGFVFDEMMTPVALIGAIKLSRWTLGRELRTIGG
ncbi:hypothetical protein [Elioraea sp.]|uniref:hypothetical protein n=1 Tax=Elioraea sp. TaxID=2185103 RepID=UPI003F6FDB37